MNIITTWDDGGLLDYKIVDLLLRYDLPGIFYIPTICELLPMDIKRMYDQGFEIGGHSTSHPSNMRLLHPEEQYSEIIMNKVWLENIIGTTVTKFCHPRGRFDDVTIDILKKIGFTEARSTLVLNTDEPIDQYRIKTTVHVFNNRVEYKGLNWYDIAKSSFDLAKSKNGYFHLWGHSWEIDIYDEWENLERFLKYMSKNL
jgi:peptidoglycan-N-acetylglucosamine deacetylase